MSFDYDFIEAPCVVLLLLLCHNTATGRPTVSLVVSQSIETRKQAIPVYSAHVSCTGRAKKVTPYEKSISLELL